MPKFLFVLLRILFFTPSILLLGSGEISLEIDREIVESYHVITPEALRKALVTNEVIYYGGTTQKYHLFYVDRTSLEGNMPWVFYDKWRMNREFLSISNIRPLDLSGEEPLVFSPKDCPRLDKIADQPVLLLKKN